MEITVNGLRKRFGETAALDGISFRARSGRPFGLLGRNGAGKTTCMRIIMDVFRPDEGEVLLDGKPLHSSGARLGYLPEERGLYRKMRVGEQLEYFGQLRGLSSRQAKTAVGEWLERLNMPEAYKNKVETLSKGNQQRIQLALAFINDPDVVILDEPFSGLDPVNAGQLRDIVSEMAAKDKLIIFSSHQMNAVENFCEDILILHHGRDVLSGSLPEIRERWPRNELRVCAADTERAARIASGYGTAERSGGALTVKLGGNVNDTGDNIDKNDNDGYKRLAAELLRELVAAETGVYSFETVEPTLEQIFVSCASDGADGKEDAR